MAIRSGVQNKSPYNSLSLVSVQCIQVLLVKIKQRHDEGSRGKVGLTEVTFDPVGGTTMEGN